MAESKKKPRKQEAGRAERQIVGFSLPIALAKEVKVEAARQQISLKELFVEMWDVYKTQKRAR